MLGEGRNQLEPLRVSDASQWQSTRFAFSGDVVGISTIRAWPGSLDILDSLDKRRDATVGKTGRFYL